MTIKTPHRRLVAVLAGLLALTAPAIAQTRANASDAFAEVHSRLTRAVDTQLEEIRAGSPARATASVAVKTSTDSSTISAPEVSLRRVNLARERLLGLRVDAAQIFLEEGVPLELLVVAEIESGFNPLALSPKGARGPWQLMPATAERFGLRVDRRTDERIHPVRAARAAARYLRELYDQFGDWPLALAAYNAGEGRVADAIERAGTRDFWRLVDLRLLPQETLRFVPAVLAIRSGGK